MILARNPRVRIDRDRILEVVLREVAAERPVWESRRLLEGAFNESRLDEFVRDRAGHSLSHVFTLLSLILPSQPLQIAFRACKAQTAAFEGQRSSTSKACSPPKYGSRSGPSSFRRARRAPPSRTTKSSPICFAPALRSPCRGWPPAGRKRLREPFFDPITQKRLPEPFRIAGFPARCRVNSQNLE